MRNVPIKIKKLKIKTQNFGFLFVILIFAFYILIFDCYAAPCYGTKMPEKNKFFVGVGTHTIFKRYLEDEFGKLRSAQNFLLVSYGVFNWLSIDLKGGAGNIKQHPVGSDEVDYPTNFAGGYGFRLKLYDGKSSNAARNNESTAIKNKLANGAKIVFGFQHISVHPKSIHLGTVKNRAILDDWQVSLLASRDFSRKSGIPPAIKQWAGKKLTPYLGTRWSRVDYIHRVDDSRKRKMSDLTKSIGLIYGLDIAVTERIWINLEGGAFDSEALAGSINFKF